MALVFTVLAVLGLLVASEIWWRWQHLHGEFTRKFVHITVGSFVAFWPYFLSPNQIKLLSIGFILVAAASKYLHIFQAIHSVQRTTWGEFWFAVVVGLLAFVTHHPHIYTAALLVMSLADGLAAVIGTRYGNARRYVVLGSPKSVVGTVTFLVVSSLILIGYNNLTPANSIGLLFLPIALGATFLENVGVRGFDNLFVPVFVSASLYLLA